MYNIWAFSVFLCSVSITLVCPSEITKSTVTAYDFNPYVKTKCVLKEDGLVIFEGFLRLIDIISAYLTSEYIIPLDAYKNELQTEKEFLDIIRYC